MRDYSTQGSKRAERERKNTIVTGQSPDAAGAIKPMKVADILEGQLQPIIVDWLSRVEKESDLSHISLSYEARAGHLSPLLHDVIARLDEETNAPISIAAGLHGDLRHKQG